MNFKDEYNGYLVTIENYLRDTLTQLKCNPTLKSAMEYSVLAGGKRIRSVMFLAMLDCLHCDYANYLPFAAALEFVHAYSLIHDDLPAMDNDDFRRGKPSNHKVFGDGIALLAGDALLNFAFELCCENVKNKNDFLAFKTLVECAGVNGMIDGQAYDLCYEKNNKQAFGLNENELLEVIHLNKTGKLLTAPIVMAFHIAGRKDLEVAEQLGYFTGLLFQITDDLLDCIGEFEQMGKTLGKDEQSGKLTAVSVFGINECKNQVENIYNKIIKIIKKLDNNSFFIHFYKMLKDRTH